jgi:hypothetical protein
MNRDFEFKQLLRAFRAGIISEQTFESEMAALENGANNNVAPTGFAAMGKTYGSEREAIAAMLDSFRAGETNGESAFSAWEKQCTTDCIRSGLRMIAEREGYHARILERRMRDLGVECKAQAREEARKFAATVSDPAISDNQKLLHFNKLVSDLDAFFEPLCATVENIREDLETKELLKLFVQDEISSTKWLQYACGALNAPADVSAQATATTSANATA